jgi:ribonuclease HII
MEGRTWINIRTDVAEEIRKYLLKNGGIEGEVKSIHEVWRVKFSDATFTYYEKGTLYSTPSNSMDPAVFEAWKYIDSLIGSRYVLPSKSFLIGLDETGKGEVIGHIVLTGIIFPSDIFNEMDFIVGPADTKKKHKFEYWDELFKKLDNFRKFGFDFIIERIPPWHVDRYNINKIMDVTYQRILSIFFREAPISECRIVIDDYGIGSTLKRFINFLKKQGAEIIVTSKADVNYLEAKLASLISKRIREEVIKRINESPEFLINGLSVGTGNLGDPQTRKWLEEWHKSGKFCPASDW